MYSWNTCDTVFILQNLHKLLAIFLFLKILYLLSCVLFTCNLYFAIIILYTPLPDVFAKWNFNQSLTITYSKNETKKKKYLYL